MPQISTVERAFQIAQSGTCSSLDELRAALTREGHTDAIAQTAAPSVRKQLQNLLNGRPATSPALKRRERGRKRGVLSLSFEHH